MNLSEEIRERAVLVGIDRPDSPWPVESSLAELARLVDTAGADVVAQTYQKLQSPNPRTFVGSGKAEEIADMARSYAADLVVFDDELTPSQQSNLEKVVGRDVKVIDRTALILDIFALHATSKEGCLQVRLAQNQYLYPRLRGMWAHLASNKMGGGVGSRFGEGESQLEVDRRIIRNRITSIKRELKHVSKVRSVQRTRRLSSGTFRISLAGYTNAGKSSLLNALTDADVLSYDKLFATLDSTTRKLKLPEGREVTLTDTVGFIRKLPHDLIDAFKSTLDEVRDADLVLHVIDASSEELDYQMRAVNDVLAQIGADGIAKVLVFNKIDLCDSDRIDVLKSTYTDSVFVSAYEGSGLDNLVQRISDAAASGEQALNVLVPYSRGDVSALAHKYCRIESEEHTEDGSRLLVLVPKELVHRFEPFLVVPKQKEPWED